MNIDWLIVNADAIWGMTLNHTRLSVIPIVLGVIISVPLGRLAAEHALSRGFIVSTSSLLYALPSLPLFIILPLVLGTSTISEINLLVALTIYAIALMVRSATDAFSGLPKTTISAATATGYATMSRFFMVELPLAGPVLLAGVRVVSVSTIALVTVGALIGSSNLGYLFTNGRATNNLLSVLTGLVLTLALAALFDLLLRLAGKLSMPWLR